MFARNIYLLFSYPSGRHGLKSANTFSCVSIVSAQFISLTYDPSHLNVFPSFTSSPFRSTPKDFIVFLCLHGKSLPTVATRFTGAKKLALIEKYVADPPKISFAYPQE